MIKTLFLKQFINDPKNIGSLLPSSRYLVSEMTEIICENDAVVELGFGDGCITKKIVFNKCRYLGVYDNNESFVSNLKMLNILPESHIMNDAFDINRQHALHSLDIVISSLPLVNFSYDKRLELISKVSNVLKRNGKFVMFSYKFKFPLNDDDLKKLGMDLVSKKIVWRNFPPAMVFVLVKKEIP